MIQDPRDRRFMDDCVIKDRWTGKCTNCESPLISDTRTDSYAVIVNNERFYLCSDLCLKNFLEENDL